MTTQYEIGVIGAGNAAEGIIHGILRNSVLLDDRIVASDMSEKRRELFAERFNIAVTDDNRHLVDNSYILLLAVKPQQFNEIASEINDLVRKDHLIVSIMAGVSTRAIEARFDDAPVRVIRVMPNLAMHVGAGMAGLVSGQFAHEADLLRAQRIFDAGGKTMVVADEALLDAITAVSGTGPAYFYYFAEAIISAGLSLGLSKQETSLLTTQTCLGAAKMMTETGDSPESLREKVTSVDGTTQAAIESMVGDKVFEHIREGVRAAFARSQALGR